MDWSERMSLAVEYIEGNLTEKIHIDEVAKVAGSSKFHFHRMFFSMVGNTPAEYIRRRKLTLAATDIATSNTRVINIALKYGFESPNAFTRAFRKIHGFPPSKARSQNIAFTVQRRATLKIDTKGKTMLDYKIIERPAFKIMGKSKDFEFDKFVKGGPKFWKDYVGSEEYNSLWEITSGSNGEVTNAPIMSVYFPNENGSRDTFTDVLGVEVNPETHLKKFEVFSVPPATYAEFDCTYRNSMKANKYIYGEWFAATGFERDGDRPDIAAYFPKAFRPTSEMNVRWWIPIIKKSS